MLQFLLKRILQSIPVLFGVASCVFFLFQIMPGDPVEMMMGQHSDISSKEAIARELGLDQPMHIQYAHYMNDLSPLSFHYDTKENQEKYHYISLIPVSSKATMVIKKPYLRRSFQDNRLVSEIIYEGLVKTFWLALAAMVFATIVGIIFGIIAALNQNTLLDHTLIATSTLGISVPSFVAAVLIAYVLAVKLHDFTGLNLYGYIIQYDAFNGKYYEFKNLILPAFTLGIRPLAIIVQLTRSSMLDVLKEDYIRTAKAKGLSHFKVIVKHALRNALNPVVTVISGWFASLLAGAFFIEAIFNWGGLGSLTVNAVFSKNFPLVMGTTLFVAFLFVIVSILVDILYAVLDPRIRLNS